MARTKPLLCGFVLPSCDFVDRTPDMAWNGARTKTVENGFWGFQHQRITWLKPGANKRSAYGNPSRTIPPFSHSPVEYRRVANPSAKGILCALVSCLS